MKSFNIITIFIVISGLIGPKAVCSESIYLDQYQTKENQKKLLASTLQESNSDSIIKIGNFVWRDLNKNGIQDSSDFPLKGVRIDLIKYDDNNVVASTKSDQKGQYEFKPDFSIDPGYYYLKFSFHKEFKPTVMDATEDKYDSDIDKTGKTDTFYLSHNSGNLDFDGGFFYSGSLTGHTIDADRDCTEAKIFEFTELNNLHFDMSPRWQSTPIPGCGSGYAFNNPAWFGFIAADSNVDFLVHVEHCDTEGNNIGLQWGVYDNCEMNNMIAGSCPCVDPKEIFINLNSLTEGETYYLFIDGCNGTFCHFWIEWLTGYCDVEVTGTGFISLNGEDIKYEKFCLGKNYTFNVDSIENADKYTWKIGDEIIETENPKLELKLRKSGYITISVFGSNNCSIGDPYATEVFVFDTIYGDLGKINAIPEQLKAGFLPSGWKGSPITKYGKDSVLVVNSFGCDQWQFIEVVGHPDYDALMSLYNSTNGQNWKENDGWKDGAAGINFDPCNGWHGVKCKDGRVIELILLEYEVINGVENNLGNNLVGELPAEIGDLDSLQYFVASDSKLKGSIPPQIGKLRNLKLLHLGNNQLGGEIPVELFNDTIIWGLVLHSNNFNNSFPKDISKLKELSFLNLSNNQFTGEIPSEIGQLSKLEYLSLSHNQLTGNIPQELSDLNLHGLNLSFNKLIGQIPIKLNNYNYLTTFNLSNNSLTGNIPEELMTLINLRELCLDNNNLSGPIPKEIGNLKLLNKLYLNNNLLSGSIPMEIGKLEELQYLNLKNNQLEGIIPGELGNMYNLIDFNAANNKLTGSLPVSIGDMNRLTSLVLNQNSLSGSIPKEIGKLYSIEKINLKDNNLSGCYPEELKQLCDSAILKIFNNNELLPWKGDFYRFCGTEDQIGAPCDDDDDLNGTNDIIDINCNCIGAVKTTDLEVGRIFFNNPVNNVLKINSEIDINQIQIFDLKGILLKGYEDINNSFMEIDLSDIAEGIYIMKIVNSNKMNIFKLLKI